MASESDLSPAWPEEHHKQYSCQTGVAISYVLHHIDERMDLKRAAEVVGLHPNYFSMKFSSETGIGFPAWIARCRISKAIGLLQSGDLTVVQVSRLVWFKLFSTFQRTIRRLT